MASDTKKLGVRTAKRPSFTRHKTTCHFHQPAVSLRCVAARFKVASRTLFGQQNRQHLDCRFPTHTDAPYSHNLRHPQQHRTDVPKSITNLNSRVCSGLQALGVECRQNVVASFCSNVVSSCGCQVVKKNVSKNAPKHVVTRHGQKHTHESNAQNHHRNNVGQKKFQKKKQMKN